MPEGERYIIVPPDRGWSWVICVASFLVQFSNDGLLYSLSTFFDDLTVEYNVSYASISATNSYFSFFYFFAGVIGCPLANYFGVRFVGILAGIMGTFGFCASCLHDTAYYLLYLYIGTIAGLGLGFSYYAASVATGFYFNKYRSLAMGIGASGTGFGQLLIPPIVAIIRRSVGRKTSFYLIALTLLSNIVFASTYLPLEPVLEATPQEETSKPIKACRLKRDPRLIPENETCRDKMIKVLDYTLLKSPSFWLYLVSGLLLNSAYMCTCFYVGKRGKSFGIPEEKADFLISTLGLTNSIGRICVGALRNVPKVDQILLSAIVFSMSGAITFIGSLDFCKNIYIQFTLVALNGLLFSPYCMRPVVAADLYGIERLTNAFGLNLLVMGFGIFILNYIFGYMFDATQSFVYIFLLCFIICVITSVLYLLLKPVREWEIKKGILSD